MSFQKTIPKYAKNVQIESALINILNIVNFLKIRQKMTSEMFEK